MKTLSSQFYGQAGAYYALFRLWETGIIAVLAPPGARRVDLLLYDGDYKLLATVQVKTRSTKNQKGWMISRKQIDDPSDDHFFIFVELDLHPKGIPTSYVVPSGVVAELGRRVIQEEPEVVEVLNRSLRSAISDPRYLNFVTLKPVLDNPEPILGAEWTNSFDNAYEIITEPLFRAAAIRLSRRQNKRN
jgi:hypothetical protein